MTVPKAKTESNRKNTRSGLDGLLRSMLDSKAITTNLEHISVVEFFEKLESDDFCKTMLVLGMVLAKMLNELTDFEVLVNELRSRSSIGIKEALQEQRNTFIRKYNITEEDKLMITKILEGVPLKLFQEETDINKSTANKRIRSLWGRLRLENRAQMLYVAGRMDLISFEPECLKS